MFSNIMVLGSLYNLSSLHLLYVNCEEEEDVIFDVS
jgi:hypothetical protein